MYVRVEDIVLGAYEKISKAGHSTSGTASKYNEKNAHFIFSENSQHYRLIDSNCCYTKERRLSMASHVALGH